MYKKHLEDIKRQAIYKHLNKKRNANEKIKTSGTDDR